MKDLSFTPDWTETMTVTEAEYELADFKFKGPGWYIVKAPNSPLRRAMFDSILVLPKECPDDVDTFRQVWKDDALFTFHVYNNRNPAAIFSLFGSAPTRQDER